MVCCIDQDSGHTLGFSPKVSVWDWSNNNKITGITGILTAQWFCTKLTYPSSWAFPEWSIQQFLFKYSLVDTIWCSIAVRSTNQTDEDSLLCCMTKESDEHAAEIVRVRSDKRKFPYCWPALGKSILVILWKTLFCPPCKKFFRIPWWQARNKYSFRATYCKHFTPFLQLSQSKTSLGTLLLQ